MKTEQIIELAKQRQEKINKITHYLNEGLSFKKIGQKFDPEMTGQAIDYYIRRYNIIKIIKPIKEYDNNR